MRELHELLRHYAGSEQRYKDLVQSMRNSTLTAFYTPPAIVRALAETLRDAGIVPRRLLDPSAGAGVFPARFREAAGHEVEILSFEKDLLSGQVLSALAQERERVVIDGFQTIEATYDDYFDVVTSNIPFGDTRIFDTAFRKSDDPVRRQALKAVHNYFFIKGLDTLREGGILAFVTSAGVMDAPGNEPVRRYLMEHARLVSAVRLPNNLFTEYAGTEVASDLVVLQKWSEKRELTPDEQRFVSSSEIGNGIYLNDYHRDFKHAIHTTFSHEKGLYGQSLSSCTTTEARNGSPSGCAESSQMISQPASTPNDIRNISVRSISRRRKPCRRPPGGKIGSRLRSPCCHRNRHPLHRLRPHRFSAGLPSSRSPVVRCPSGGPGAVRIQSACPISSRRGICLHNRQRLRMPRRQSLRRLRRIKIRGPLPARCFRTTKSDRWFCSKGKSGVWAA
ncbi:MAG: N-6 DNA methylase [Alistipes finegoldii]